MEALFERLKIQQKQLLPFVLYKKPNAKTMVGVFQKDDELYFSENLTEKGFVFAPFSGIPICFPHQKSNLFYYDFVDFVDFEEAEEISVYEHSNKDKIHFTTLVSKGIESINQGVFDKIVLSRKEIVEIGTFDLETTFKKILQNYPSAFCYCWYHPKVGLWLGATPEKLFCSNNSKFQTMALAGTQTYKENATPLWKDKERNEQKYVTEFIVNELKKETTSITVSEPYTVRAGNLVHICTDIEGLLNHTTNLKNIITVLHPTPAVCGLPKENAKFFIETNENYDREFYTGFLGEINSTTENENASTDLYVNLRCMKIIAHQAHLFIGCGITRDSNPESEWQETVNKSNIMKKVIL